MPRQQLYGMVSLDEIHRNGSAPNAAYNDSSTDSIPATVNDQPVVDYRPRNSPTKLVLTLSRVQKVILAVLTLLILVLVVVSIAIFVLMLHQREDLATIKGGLNQGPYSFLKSPASTDLPTDAYDKTASEPSTDTKQQDLASDKVRNENHRTAPFTATLELTPPGVDATPLDGDRKYTLDEYSAAIRQTILKLGSKDLDFSQTKGDEIRHLVELELNDFLKLHDSICKFYVNSCPYEPRGVDPQTATRYTPDKSDLSTHPMKFIPVATMNTNVVPLDGDNSNVRNITAPLPTREDYYTNNKDFIVSETASPSIHEIVTSPNEISYALQASTFADDGETATANHGDVTTLAIKGASAASYAPVSTLRNSRQPLTSSTAKSTSSPRANESSDTSSVLFQQTRSWQPHVLNEQPPSTTTVTDQTSTASVQAMATSPRQIHNRNTTTVDRDIVTGWYLASNGLQYKYIKEKCNYWVAMSQCVGRKGRLASTGLRDEATRNELYNMAGGFKFWIGLDDLKNASHWVWSDGVESPEEELPWDEGQPNHAGSASLKQECVEIVLPGKFNDEFCILPQTFLCEKG